MHTQVWIGGSVTSMLLLVAASEWVQLHMVEPSGKKKLKQTSRDNEQDFLIQTSEANMRTAEAEMKVETTNPITKFPSVGTSDTFTDRFPGNRINKHNSENDKSGTQLHNSEVYLNHNEHVFTSQILKSHYMKPDSESHFQIQMPEETNTVIQLSHQLPLNSVLETEASDTKTPQSSEQLTSSNFNTPNYPPRHDLEVTTMQADAKLPNPVTINHHSDVTDPVSKFSNTPYETKTTPYSTVTKNNENPKGIATSSKLNGSSTTAHSDASWLPATGNSNNTTDGNTAQDTKSALDMLRAVHKTLIQETSHTIRGKMHFLQHLKDKMLLYIEGRIKGLWTTDNERQARTEKGVEFPSMEGALMSISFLIFAVFLIKLVQQLIQGLQANSTAKMSRRHSRSLPDLLTTARVLHLIDNFPLQYEDNGWS